MYLYRVTVYNASGSETDCQDFSDRLDADVYARRVSRHGCVATVRPVSLTPNQQELSHVRRHAY